MAGYAAAIVCPNRRPACFLRPRGEPQTGLFVLVGLESKGAILIAVFAARSRRVVAAQIAAHRSISAGPSPDSDDVLCFHHGRRAANRSSRAGAEMRNAMGVTRLLRDAWRHAVRPVAPVSFRYASKNFEARSKQRAPVPAAVE